MSWRARLGEPGLVRLCPMDTTAYFGAFPSSADRRAKRRERQVQTQIDPRFARDESGAKRGSCYFLPDTVKWARRFRCQQSSPDSVQTGTSLP